MYKHSKWAKEILALQKGNGMWGYFHTLSEPNKNPITTEQALRRLSILGYTINDEPIQKAVEYMSDCLSGKNQIPDRHERIHDWGIFTNLMLSTWIRKFTKENSLANNVAKVWGQVISAAFVSGQFEYTMYTAAYHDAFGIMPKGGRLVDFSSFYQVSLTCDQYDEKTEKMVLNYLLHHESGIYYVYSDAQIALLPKLFASKQASRYICAIEILSSYKRSTSELQFVADWINDNRNENGGWDMGSGTNDKIYFPLSDSWRKRESREMDCTYRIQNLLNSLNTTTYSDI